MVIGIIGSLGIVGAAHKFAFKKLGSVVLEHDIRLNTTVDDVLLSDIVYICVPTPKNEDGSCNTSIVEQCVRDLLEKKYIGRICIKSTVTPGTTQKLIDLWGNHKICHSAEFLRERSAITDIMELNRVLVVGSIWNSTSEIVIENHGNLPKSTLVCTPTESELIKYYHNLLGSLRVTVANEYYEICKHLGANYNVVKAGIVKSCSLPDIYLDSNESGVSGWSSICWNKDIPAINALIKEFNLNLPVIQHIIPSNDRLKKTPFADTRENY